MSQSFIRVRSKQELDKLIDSIIANKKTLTQTVTNTVVGDQFAKAEAKKAQAPILEGLKDVSNKIEERIAPPVQQVRRYNTVVPQIKDKVEDEATADVGRQFIADMIGFSNRSITGNPPNVTEVKDSIRRALASGHSEEQLINMVSKWPYSQDFREKLINLIKNTARPIKSIDNQAPVKVSSLLQKTRQKVPVKIHSDPNSPAKVLPRIRTPQASPHKQSKMAPVNPLSERIDVFMQEEKHNIVPRDKLRDIFLDMLDEGKSEQDIGKYINAYPEAKDRTYLFDVLNSLISHQATTTTTSPELSPISTISNVNADKPTLTPQTIQGNESEQLDTNKQAAKSQQKKANIGDILIETDEDDDSSIVDSSDGDDDEKFEVERPRQDIKGLMHTAKLAEEAATKVHKTIGEIVSKPYKENVYSFRGIPGVKFEMIGDDIFNLATQKIVAKDVSDFVIAAILLPGYTLKEFKRFIPLTNEEAEQYVKIMKKLGYDNPNANVRPTQHSLKWKIYYATRENTGKEKKLNLRGTGKAIRERSMKTLMDKIEAKYLPKYVLKRDLSPTGMGISSSTDRKYDPYKMSASGKFGNLDINVPNLNKLLLTVKKNGQRICHQPCPYDLVELLTKRYNPKKNYHPEATDLFAKLVRQAEIPITSVNSGKFKNIINDCGCNERSIQPLSKKSYQGIKVYSDPDEVANRLQIIMGEMGAGNDSTHLKNEAAQLIDWLKQKGLLDNEEQGVLMKANGLID